MRFVALEITLELNNRRVVFEVVWVNELKIDQGGIDQAMLQKGGQVDQVGVAQASALAG